MMNRQANSFTSSLSNRINQKRLIKYTLALLWRSLILLTNKGASKNHITVLNYHSVSPSSHPEGAEVSPENLDRQVQILMNENNVISVSEAIHMLASKEDFSSAVVITFDDGFVDNYEYALPILLRHNCPATIFLATAFVNGEIDLVDDQNFTSLSWEEIKEMESTGLVTFASHSHNHNIVSKLSKFELKSDLQISKNLLNEKLNTNTPYFAYPNGQGKDFNKESVETLKELDFHAAFSTLWGTNTIKTDKYALKRIRIDGTDSEKEFRMKVRGDYNYIGMIHDLKKYLR